MYSLNSNHVHVIYTLGFIPWGNTPGASSLLCSTITVLTGEFVYTPRGRDTVSSLQLPMNSRMHEHYSSNPAHCTYMYMYLQYNPFVYSPSFLPCWSWSPGIVIASRGMWTNRLSDTLFLLANLSSFLRWTLKRNFLPILSVKVRRWGWEVWLWMIIVAYFLILTHYRVPLAKLYSHCPVHSTQILSKFR